MSKKRFPLIVFCGIDGSGKTTLAKKLFFSLKEKRIDCEIIHAHAYSISEDSFGIRENTIKKFKCLFRLAIPFALLDNFFTYYFKYLPILREKILICDRYFYDKITRLHYYGISTALMTKVYLSLLPKPDYTFFLDVRTESAKIRKNEYSKEEYISFRESYKLIMEKILTKTIVINTESDIDETFGKVVTVLRGTFKNEI